MQDSGNPFAALLICATKPVERSFKEGEIVSTVAALLLLGDVVVTAPNISEEIES
jgi:hypothetical protein